MFEGDENSDDVEDEIVVDVEDELIIEYIEL